MLVDVQTVTVVIAGISVIVGVINSILSSRRATKNNQIMLETRQAQLFMQIYDRWISPEFRLPLRESYHWEWKDFDDYSKKYGGEERATNFMIPGNFFEGIGVLVEFGLIDINLVNRLLRNSIINFWEQFKPIILEYRKPRFARVRHDRQPPFDSLEYLYNRILELDQQQATPST